MIAQPDLRGETASSKAAEAETSGAMVAVAVDQEAANPVVVRLVEPEFKGHVDADRCHSAADPSTQQSGLGGRPVAAVEDRHALNPGQASEHPGHVEKLRGDVPPGDQPCPVEVADRGLRLPPAGYRAEAAQ